MVPNDTTDFWGRRQGLQVDRDCLADRIRAIFDRFDKVVREKNTVTTMMIKLR